MLFDENGEIHSNPNDIANLLQAQFLSVFSDPSKTQIDKAAFTSPSVEYPFTNDILQSTNTDLIGAIDDIKPNAASGPDEILASSPAAKSWDSDVNRPVLVSPHQRNCKQGSPKRFLDA